VNDVIERAKLSRKAENQEEGEKEKEKKMHIHVHVTYVHE